VQTLADQTNFRTSGQGLTGVTQEMVSNPNSVLTSARSGLTIASTVMLQVSTDDPAPSSGAALWPTRRSYREDRTAPTPSRLGSVCSTFWIQTIQRSAQPNLLQYSQTVLLNFNGVSWPHVSVATLRPAPTP
jgi:hypothetical protein